MKAIVIVCMVGALTMGMLCGCATDAPRTSQGMQSSLEKEWKAVSVDDFAMPRTTPFDARIPERRAYLQGYRQGLIKGIEYRGYAELTPVLLNRVEELPTEEQAAFLQGWYKGLEQTAEKLRDLQDEMVDEMIKDLAEQPTPKPVAKPKPTPAPLREEEPRRMKQAKPAPAPKPAPRPESSDPFAPMGL